MTAQTIRKMSLAALLGFAAFAASATEWTYYAAGVEGNPTKVDCIFDGNWALQVAKLDASTKSITFGGESYTACIKKGEGVLDLRGTVTVDGVAYDKKIFNSGIGRNYSGGITEFYADNVESFGVKAFQNCRTLTTASVTGTFAIIGELSFDWCPALTNVVLNSPALATIGEKAFQSSTALTSIEITSGLALTVDSTAMQFNKPLTSLTINSPVWEMANVDNLLSANSTSDTTKNCTIYANKDTWKSLAAAVTDEEKEHTPKNCFGVYVTAKGSRKAWLVANDDDPIPLRIIIR